MNTYKELYFHLFNALTDAIENIEEGRVIIAIDRMKRAQIVTEEAHLQKDILLEE